MRSYTQVDAMHHVQRNGVPAHTPNFKDWVIKMLRGAPMGKHPVARPPPFVEAVPRVVILTRGRAQPADFLRIGRGRPKMLCEELHVPNDAMYETSEWF
eukprot:5141750-Pyramimonas_sp.AAC.1